MTAPRWTYPERRALALKLADECTSFDHPHIPEGTGPLWARRYLPHAQAVGILGAAKVPPPDKYGHVSLPNSLRLMAYFEAKEKNQNRTKVLPFI